MRIRTVAFWFILGAIFLACSATQTAPEAADAALRGSTISFHARGLDEDVQFIRSGIRKYVHRANGTLQSIAAFRAEERTALQTRFGALDPNLAKVLHTTPNDRRVLVSVWYDLTPPSTIATGSKGVLAPPSKSAAVVAKLTAAGGIDIKVSHGMPLVYARLTPRAIESIARENGVIFVTSAEAEQPQNHAGAPAYMIPPLIDTGFNATGYYGDGQKLGLIESAGCRLFSEHDSFNGSGHNSTFVYQTAIHSCTSDNDCVRCGGGTGTSHDFCIGGSCVVNHASIVAGMVSGSRAGTAYGAAGVNFYYPNQGEIDLSSGLSYPQVQCYPPGEDNAFDWLRQQGVHITNSSYGC